MNRKLIFLFFIPVCGFLSAAAQTDLLQANHFMKDTAKSFRANVKGNYFFSSDAITNAFAAGYYQRKYLTDDLKNGVSDNLSGRNSLAGEANWEASLTFHPDTGNNSIEGMIAFRSRSFAEARFSKDFFNLFFRGNKMFAGQTADLSNFFFQQCAYRQIVFGIGKEFNLSENKKIYAGADFAVNQGIKFLKVTGRQASIYTDPGGEYIDADLHATIMTDDSASLHPSKLDGTGYSGDLYLEFQTENNLVSFSAENFGNIHWNKWSTVVTLDSTFHFDGIDVRDIFEFGDSIQVTGLSIDSVFYENYVRHRTEQRVTTRLPMKVSASWTMFFNARKISATFGSDLLVSENSSLRYYAGVTYTMGRANKVGIVMATGGTTDFHSGLNYTHLFPWNFTLEIGSNYLYPLVIFNSGKSQGAYISLSKSF